MKYIPRYYAFLNLVLKLYQETADHMGICKKMQIWMKIETLKKQFYALKKISCKVAISTGLKA